MDFKQSFQESKNRFISFWKKGKIQRTSRVTYDVAWNIILFFIVVSVIVAVFAGGAGAGYFASLVKDEPLRDYDEMQRDIYNYEETSKLYFAGEKYIGDIRADLHREEVALDDISPTLVNAVIATEDDLFYEHNGIVPKAIIRAVYQDFSGSDTRTGGSTLTQQLIKNQILTNEVSFERKAKEILLAMRLENFFEKDEIMEAYLNIVPYGRDASGQNIAGIQTAAKGIFGVDTDELTLPQAAFLAGVPQNPYAYTPFLSNGDIKDEEDLALGISRMHTVLKRMYQNDFITEEEYNEAIEYDITEDLAERAPSSIDQYPAIVIELEKRAKEILLEQLAEDDGYELEEINSNEELKEQYEMLADRALRMNGYNIHSTVDKEMYDTMDKVVKEYPYYGPDKTFTKEGNDEPTTEQFETGAVLIENDTRKILAFSPGRDYSATDRAVDHAFDANRSPGSTIKPLLVYGPAMEMGAIQPGSVFADIELEGTYKPNNAAGVFYGLVSAREGLAKSHNVTTVKVYQEIVHENPAKNYLMKMGYKLENLNADRQEAPSLALGTTEVSVENNVNAFATFGNDGVYEDSYMIEKITDSDGEIVYEHEGDPVEVFSKQTAYLTVDMMRDVLTEGTATYVPSKLNHSGVDWAGKTGTSQDHHDSWFIATNPNVTFGTWMGYDTPSSINCIGCSLSYSQQNQHLWADLINALTEVDQELMAPSEGFQQPDNIVSRDYCATSGMAASELCAKVGLVKSDIYNAKYTPDKTDDSLVGSNMALVTVDGMQVVASSKTPSEFTSSGSGGVSFNPEFLERMGYDKLNDLSVLIPRANPDAWAKIGLKAGSSTSGAISEEDDSKPSAPGSVQASKDTISWSGANGELIVGYRIYQSGGDKLIGHTTDTSYATPKSDGEYYVRAVNYFGTESDSSKKVTVKTSNNKDNNKEKNKEKDKDKDKDKKKDQKKEKDKNKDDNKDSDKKDKDQKDKKDKDKEKEKESEDDSEDDSKDKKKKNEKDDKKE